MDKITIELMSANKLSEVLLKSKRLFPIINTLERIPIWDGYVIIYQNEKGSNKNIIGKVDIQLKGSYKKNLTIKSLSCNLRRTDLRSYLIAGGAIIFKVCFDEHDNYKIYYNALTASKLKCILKICGTNKTKAIRLVEFPLDAVNMSNIFMEVLDDKIENKFEIYNLNNEELYYKMIFKDFILRYNILSYLDYDPYTSGIPIMNIRRMDYFLMDVKKFLDRYYNPQKMKRAYEDIRDFYYSITCYHTSICRHSFLDKNECFMMDKNEAKKHDMFSIIDVEKLLDRLFE